MCQRFIRNSNKNWNRRKSPEKRKKSFWGITEITLSVPCRVELTFQIKGGQSYTPQNNTTPKQYNHYDIQNIFVLLLKWCYKWWFSFRVAAMCFWWNKVVYIMTLRTCSYCYWVRVDRRFQELTSTNKQGKYCRVKPALFQIKIRRR